MNNHEYELKHLDRERPMNSKPEYRQPYLEEQHRHLLLKGS
jgi:hypothetical protein